MTNATDMVDRIVAGVLEQLQAPVADAAPATPSSIAATDPLMIDDPVITAALLETRGVVAGPVVFSVRAILTPSARDFLSSRKIVWKKATQASPSLPTTTTWSLLVSRSTPALDSALATGAQPGARLNRELVGCHREAARRAVAALCRGECDGVIAFTGKPEALACYANRSPAVRAVVVQTSDGIKRVNRTVGPNLFAVDPGEQSVFALRSLLREIVLGGKPAAPADWSE
jgi:hypothetical protein